MTGGWNNDGEQDFIQRYLAPLAKGYEGAFGLADDCALIAIPNGSELVTTVDAVSAGVHFFPDDAPDDIAWKALAANVSDLAAKAAEPSAYLMSLSFSEAPTAPWMEAYCRGLQEAQSAFGLHLAGGDTDIRPGPLNVTITAFGFVPAGALVLRSGGQPDDIVFVSGTIGDSFLGLAERGATGETGNSAPKEEKAFLRQRYLRPSPRIGLARALRAHASAAIDISDGLLKDLAHLAHASGVGLRLELPDMPLSGAARRRVEAGSATLTDLATGGMDYEIIAAVSEDKAGAFLEAAHDSGVPVAACGVLTAEKEFQFRGRDGELLDVGALGYDHFATSRGSPGR